MNHLIAPRLILVCDAVEEIFHCESDHLNDIWHAKRIRAGDVEHIELLGDHVNFVVAISCARVLIVDFTFFDLWLAFDLFAFVFFGRLKDNVFSHVIQQLAPNREDSINLSNYCLRN